MNLEFLMFILELVNPFDISAKIAPPSFWAWVLIKVESLISIVRWFLNNSAPPVSFAVKLMNVEFVMNAFSLLNIAVQYLEVVFAKMQLLTYKVESSA